MSLYFSVARSASTSFLAGAPCCTYLFASAPKACWTNLTLLLSPRSRQVFLRAAKQGLGLGSGSASVAMGRGRLAAPKKGAWCAHFLAFCWRLLGFFWDPLAAPGEATPGGDGIPGPGLAAGGAGAGWGAGGSWGAVWQNPVLELGSAISHPRIWLILGWK